MLETEVKCCEDEMKLLNFSVQVNLRFIQFIITFHSFHFCRPHVILDKHPEVRRYLQTSFLSQAILAKEE